MLAHLLELEAGEASIRRARSGKRWLCRFGALGCSRSSWSWPTKDIAVPFGVNGERFG